MQIILSERWHHRSAEDLCELLGTHPEHGLDTFEVANRRGRFGANVLPQPAGRGPLVRLLLQFHQPLIYILLGAVAVTLALGEFIDAGVILAVVVINAIVSFAQEAKALTAIAALARSLSHHAMVVRGGEKTRIAASELVPGDLVLLQSGDRVPADLRLIRVRELQIDESALTGESVPVGKHASVLDAEAVLADRRNMAYSSALVTYGTSAGIVTAIGEKTEIGRVSELIATTEVLETPLTRKIHRFSHVLLIVIMGFAILTLLVGLLHGRPFEESLMAAVALAVGAIPEGLPAAVTIILAIGVSRMAARRTIIRRLPAVEALGSTTVVCSDKTGTLTQNQMTVQAITAGGERFQVEGAGYAPHGAINRDGAAIDVTDCPALLECLRCGLLCNDAELDEEGGRFTLHGDPTEGALVTSAMKGGLHPDDVRKAWRRLDAVPFESQHQYMATLHVHPQAGNRTAYVKGSLESLLPRCSHALQASGDDADIDRNQIEAQAEAITAGGLRVLALARKVFPPDAASVNHPDLEDGLTFLGLQGMLDPPREEAARAVRACQHAGVLVKMITGDHATTAERIAVRLGIIDEPTEAGPKTVLNGRELSALSDAELVAAAERTAVFARVSPEHKLRLVQALQARGHVVAMTGDGVNDAPALRRADIGVAMGQGGTEVAREAADMVLTDDNFASIEAAIEEGRSVFDNLLKFIVWTLPTNGGEGIVLMVAVFLGLSLPILPVQILWINMTTAVCLGLMLAFEPREPGLMDRPPRDPRTPLLTGPIVMRIGLVSILLCIAAFGLYWFELVAGATEAQARTVAVAAIVTGETFYLFNCRSLTKSMFGVGVFSNPWLGVGVGVMTGLQLLFTYAPFMNRLFATESIGPAAWLRVVGCGLAIYLVVGLEKWLGRRRAAHRL